MNSYQMLNPEAFQEEYEEEQRILRELAKTPRIGTPEMEQRAIELEAMYRYQDEVQGIYTEEPEADLCDIIRAYEEDRGEED
jgi:hypothetical protein